MASFAQLTGMQAVFLVAAELSARGMIVTTTSRNAMGADLLVTDQACRKTWSVQVKANRKPAAFWLVGSKARETVSASHIYVLVNLRSADGTHEFYVVPSRDVARLTKESKRPNSVFYSVRRSDVAGKRGRWELFLKVGR
jgi:hypothetical protein